MTGEKAWYSVYAVLKTFTVCRSIPFGTRQGLVECEYQFRNDRWNCTDNRSPQVLQSTLERGELKETVSGDRDFRPEIS